MKQNLNNCSKCGCRAEMTITADGLYIIKCSNNRCKNSSIISFDFKLSEKDWNNSNKIEERKENGKKRHS